MHANALFHLGFLELSRVPSPVDNDIRSYPQHYVVHPTSNVGFPSLLLSALQQKPNPWSLRMSRNADTFIHTRNPGFLHRFS